MRKRYDEAEGTVNYVVNVSPGGGELVALSAGCWDMRRGNTIRLIAEKNHTLYFVERGKGDYRGQADSFALCEGDCLCIHPGRFAVVGAGETMQLRFVSFGGTAIGEVLDHIGFSPTEPILRAADMDRTAELFHIVYGLIREKQANYAFKAGAYLRLLLSEFSALTDSVQDALNRASHLSPNVIDHRIHSLIEWMSARYAETVSIRDMAEFTGYSERYFRRVFSKATGMSPLEFLAFIRIDRAKHLLFEPMSIKQIARAVGYQDPLHFSKQFKMRTGLSPKRFRAYAQERLTAGEAL
ncbi:helix-turn-helix transcriptional regulator [Paenibacillus rhizovicinus]|uniref:Helix-turn-helix transcriptional regulator n=1 Tax=Paenibacillus rhizovicinus TaxID=2704463 RepID=A0A6C0P8D3_9BACL|nr:AraC family transcriptional regulator [Paenibacillus rhizovicinus]QHW34729.1 helix-turn-helix transcriptional regulator [Paenibacillus rhizovicinus]